MFKQCLLLTGVRPVACGPKIQMTCLLGAGESDFNTRPEKFFSLRGGIRRQWYCCRWRCGECAHPAPGERRVP